ncbi:hypothetical protein HPP92_001592 [Vanilla planifolia]|uniref:Uncharacterized protein n=1 Tax=Vanilla planifolia TaxID=51239 RepID=A0A835VLJ2_VANPL|nr:hypothetical protein HPP92_001592 [Vanilla planifolia]
MFHENLYVSTTGLEDLTLRPLPRPHRKSASDAAESAQARIAISSYPLLPLAQEEKARAREREREFMETIGFNNSSRAFLSPILPNSPATHKFGTRISAARKGSTVFPLGEGGPRQTNNDAPAVKLLSNVEKLRLLTKAEKAGLLSLAESFGLSLSTVERLGLLSKAEELGVLSAVTDPNTPTVLLALSLVLLLLGPACVYLVPEENAVEVAVQAVVVLASVVGGSAAFAASNFVAKLQR